MKTKIIAVGLLTFLLLSLSIKLFELSDLNYSIKGFILNYSDGGTQINSGEIREEETPEFPVFQRRNTNSYRNTLDLPKVSSYIELLSSSNENQSYSQPFSGSSTYTQQSRTSTNSNNQANNYRPIASLSTLRKKTTGEINSFSSEEAIKIENDDSKLNAPFSGGGIHGPMRMDGDDENPPPEGVPVGNGLWIMIAMTGVYVFIKHKKTSIQH